MSFCIILCNVVKGDDDYEALMIKQKATAVEETASLDDRPECEYGTSCYRQNPQHKKDFKHTQSPQLPASPGPTTKRPGTLHLISYIYA